MSLKQFTRFQNNVNAQPVFTEEAREIMYAGMDCLSAAVEYNKTFYSDGDLKPQKNIFFMIKILPFVDTNNSPTSF